VLPVERNASGFREIVARAGRDYTERCFIAGTEDAVDRFVDAAVAAGNNNTRAANVNLLTDPLFEVADARALVQRDIETLGVKQFKDAGLPPTCPPATCGRVEKQVNRFVGHQSSIG